MRRGLRTVLIVVLAVVIAAAGVRLLWWQGFLGLATRARMAIAPTAEERQQEQARRAFAAIDAHDPAALERIVKEAGTPDLHSADGETPLLHAIRAHEVAVVRWLVAQGARVTEVPGKPLLQSIPSPSPDELHALLAAGADPYARDAHGSSFFAAAVGEPNPERLEIVLAAGLPKSKAELQAVLSGAAIGGNAPVMKALLDAGADPDAHPEGKQPPILDAAEHGRLEVVKELLSRPGQRAAATDAMVGAAANGYTDVVLALQAAGTPLPEVPSMREKIEHILSQVAAATFEERHKPVPATWDGPLLVQTYLLEKCGQSVGDSELPARWADVDLPVSSLGRAEGDEVLALLSEGRAVQARFGRVTCFTGECGQGWYEVTLAGVEHRDVLAIAPPGFVPEGGRVHALTESNGRCAPPVPRPPAEGKWQPTCSVWRGPGELAIELLRYVAASDEYVQEAVHARLLGDKPGPWLKLGAKPELAPRLAVESTGAPVRFVFWRPGRLSTGDSLVCVVRAKPGNALELGRCYAAGGQPCD